VVAPVDYAMSHDNTTPLAIESLHKLDRPIWDTDRVVIAFDHMVPAPTPAAAELHRTIRAFIAEQGIQHVFQEGVCHQVMMERGFVMPGGLVVGADSHSCTYGALGCFGTGMGSTDVAVIFATGRSWFRIPETMRITLHGTPRHGVFAKDICLALARELDVDGATYMAIEYGGEAVAAMEMPERMTLSNKSIEMGAKAGLGHRHAKGTQVGEGMRDEGSGEIRRRGAVEVGARAFAQIAQQRELRHHQHGATAIQHRASHFALLVGKDAQPREFLCQRGHGIRRVAGRDAHQRHPTGANGPDALIGHRHLVHPPWALWGGVERPPLAVIA